MQAANQPERRLLAAAADVASLLPKVVQVAAPAILLGLLTKILVYVGTLLVQPASAGDNFIPDLLSRISWAFLVCVTLELATALAHQRAWLVALTGLIVAPVAFHLARGVREGALAILRPPGASATSVVVIGMVKGIEYAALGIILAYLTERSPRPHHFAAAGLAIGVVFGGAIFALSYGGAPQSPDPASLVGWVVLEIFFPTACALVVFVTEVALARSAEE